MLLSMQLIKLLNRWLSTLFLLDREPATEDERVDRLWHQALK